MTTSKKPPLPVELWRDVNRAAYALAQASFSEQRARLAAEAADLLKQGRTLAEVRAAMLVHERRAA